jgi:cyclopropane fatty-acyl-phospholipid synthase-like methyltransferase
VTREAARRDGVDSFYATYAGFKDYQTPVLGQKDVRQMDRDVWTPAKFGPGMSVLEIGCGTGLFLAYLHAKGLDDIVGIDHDPDLAEVMPADVRDAFIVADMWDYLGGEGGARRFDRIAMFDVLEHFTPADGLMLLQTLRGMLAEGGRIVLRVPNMASPWGAAYQFGDLTHRAAYTPGSLRQLAIAAGLEVVACYGQPSGSAWRWLLDRAFHRVLSKAVATPPAVWTPNVYAVLRPRNDGARR